MTALYVTNYNPRFTGVSATAATVLRQQRAHHDLALVGQPLPGAPSPISPAQAHRQCRAGAPEGLPFAIWHVRRNPEMRSALWLRDVRRAPVKIVFTSAAQRLHSAYPRWLISRMDAVIATTEAAAQFVPHVRAVVPHGVDCDLFTPAPDRAAAWRALGFGGAEGIATVGRIRPEKGTDLFVEAMLRLLPQRPGAVALVVGRAGRSHAGFLDGLKAKVAAAGLTDRLLFPGELPPERLPALMQGLSAVVQLPRYEGYGMVPLEAMASGTPFVASDTGYYQQFSDQGRTGTIIGPAEAPDASQRAAEATQVLLDEADARAGHCRATAQARFSAQAEAAGIEKVYQSLWNGG